jgi:ubiquinone/menaquinone biosynthesis C-methylase UbiE
MTEKPGVASHLRIPLAEYDSRIRTFVPYYAEMLDEVERTVAAWGSACATILDLGIGTGALAERCLTVRPEARLIGIDSDEDMLEQARIRLAVFPKIDLRCGSFLDLPLPESDLIVASIALHHVSRPETKVELYGKCRAALRTGGALLTADCFPASDPHLARIGMEIWKAHLQESYSSEEAAGHLDAWSEEDTYFSLPDELAWMEAAGLRPEVVWRRDPFAVLLGRLPA